MIIKPYSLKANQVKFVVTLNNAILGTTSDRKSAEKLARNERNYFTACGFNVQGSMKYGYYFEVYGELAHTSHIIVWTLADFLDATGRDALDNLLADLCITADVYYRYSDSHGRVFTHNPTSAEIVRFVSAYVSTVIVPANEVWRNDSNH
jgi:hypothetical protein